MQKKCRIIFPSKRLLGVLLGFVTLVKCTTKPGCNSQDIEKVSSYLGITLDSIRNVCFYEYNIIDGEEYPKSIYLKFNYSDPENLIKKLDLLPFPPLSNNDTSRLADYEYAKLINNFWKLRSTKTTKGIIDVEKNISSWWNPGADLNSRIYGGFYNEFYQKRIVSIKQKWTGRLAMQPKKDTVFIQIDLFQGL